MFPQFSTCLDAPLPSNINEILSMIWSFPEIMASYHSVLNLLFLGLLYNFQDSPLHWNIFWIRKSICSILVCIFTCKFNGKFFKTNLLLVLCLASFIFCTVAYPLCNTAWMILALTENSLPHACAVPLSVALHKHKWRVNLAPDVDELHLNSL